MKKVRGLILAAVAVLFAGCVMPQNPSNKSEDDGEYKGHITKNVTFENETIYINHSLFVEKGGVLNCTNATIKFGPNGKITVRPNSGIYAVGTVFTSCNDDAHGEILKVSKAKPAPNDWQGVLIGGGKGAFTNCTFSYAGAGKNGTSALASDWYERKKGEMIVLNCTFANNGGIDSALGGTAALCFGGNAAAFDSENNYVSTSTFKDNLWPLCIPTDFSITDSSNTFENNKYNGVYVAFDNERKIENETVWAHLSVPYCYMHGSANLYICDAVNKPHAGLLNIKGGTASEPTVIKFYAGALELQHNTNNDSVDPGFLYVGDNVLFTSYDDDGEWAGIWLDGFEGINLYYTTNKTHNIVVENYNPESRKINGTAKDISNYNPKERG